MEPKNNIAATPWYRQFWPWFLITLPATAVVGGLITIWIAVQQNTSLVKDSYYQEGLDINTELEKQATARTENIKARLQFLEENRKISLYLQGDAPLPEQLQLLLTAPMDPAKDRKFKLRAIAPGLYQAQLNAPLRGNYYLRLEALNGRWIIKGKAFLPENDLILLPATE